MPRSIQCSKPVRRNLPYAAGDQSIDRKEGFRGGWKEVEITCKKSISVHALSCAKGGFPTLRHNEIRDTTASLLTEVCSEVCVETNLQPVSADQLNGASANSQEGARLDISANGVWGGRFQKTYFNVRVFNPLAPSNRNQPQASR